MEKLKALITGIAVIAGTARLAGAHPPTQVSLNYDAATATLTAQVHHAVKDENAHFIGDVVVSVNGMETVTQVFPKQTDKQKQLAVYLLPGLKPGDEITVETECNRIGKKKAALKIK